MGQTTSKNRAEIKPITTRLRLRRDYSKFQKVMDVPNLIQIQCSSFDRFLQPSVSFEDRDDIGLQAVFKSVFPIKDYNDTASLEFVSYTLGEPKYDVRECHERGMTWAAPLKVTVQLVLWEVSADGARQIRDIKEQEVYFGEIPLMTAHGTFLVNGSERVVVSQLHRSPGVFFDHDKGKSHSSGKLLYNARVIPYRGSWLDFEFDVKDLLYVRIDRRRKQHASILLRALGLTTEQILTQFYKTDIISVDEHGKLTKKFIPDQFEGHRAVSEIKSGDRVLAKVGQKFNRAILRRIGEAGIDSIELDSNVDNNFCSAKTIVRVKEVIIDSAGKPLAAEGDVIVGWIISLSSLLSLWTQAMLKRLLRSSKILR